VNEVESTDYIDTGGMIALQRFLNPGECVIIHLLCFLLMVLMTVESTDVVERVKSEGVYESVL
jgi:hypothetical protein